MRPLLAKHKRNLFLFTLILVSVHFLKMLLSMDDTTSLKKCLIDYNNENEAQTRVNTNSLNESSSPPLPRSSMMFPSALTVHSHLKHINPDYLMPKFRLKNPNRLASVALVIGVSTVKRENASYLTTMLDSLFHSMNRKEKEQVLVVLLVAEVFIL